MRSTTVKDTFYSPGIVPANAEQMRQFLQDELEKIRMGFELVSLGHLTVTHVAPTKPRKGDIRYADGSDWNPGTGTGIYYYNGSAWVEL